MVGIWGMGIWGGNMGSEVLDSNSHVPPTPLLLPLLLFSLLRMCTFVRLSMDPGSVAGMTA